MSEVCPFCLIANNDTQGRIIEENGYAFLIRDGFPVSPGHSLIIPKRHVSSFFESTHDEKLAMIELLEKAKGELDKKYQPASYNIGINDGCAAGQTVPHCHIHLIPRYDNDASDPRGGVRWVIPDKADYWSDR